MNSLSPFQNIHKDETIIVCGCGESLNDLNHPERFITIGVNDVGRRFDPTYLVVLNPRHQFKNDRFHYVETSRAQTVFTQLDLGINHPNIVRFKLGKRGGTDFSDPNTLPYTQNSPYVALCLAARMGAKHIGFIGVDFTNNHFFGKTGRHVLNGKLASVDQEYRDLEKGLSNAGIKAFNLSRQSKITAFEKMDIEDFYKLAGNSDSVESQPIPKELKIFFVNYKFLSCGDVFRTGLNHAATDLGIASSEAYWDDPKLPDKVRQFDPDLIFVVHGRKFARKWGQRFKNYNTAVWLLDEPYEVDDTSKFSGLFDTVYVNDPNTIHCHRSAHYLPVCYDHHSYFPVSDIKKYDVGFIGGYNNVRQKLLERLHNEGLLSYVIGGPWKGGNLKKICISKNIPAHEVAGFYRQTKIVVNIFREVHHYNRQKILAFSLNPRVYEAIACGAVVVSECREEIDKVFPEIPAFENCKQLVEIIKELLNDENKYEAVRKNCFQRLKGHAYVDRLKRIIPITMANKSDKPPSKQISLTTAEAKRNRHISTKATRSPADWEDYGRLVESNGNQIILLRKAMDHGPGTERGLVSKEMYSSVDLSFEVNIESGSCFIAKINQAHQYDQLTNSYHLMCDESKNYFARHFHIFKHLSIDRNTWEKIRITFLNGTITFYRDEVLVFSIDDFLLKSGYAFLGIKGGVARMRNIFIKDRTKRLVEKISEPVVHEKEYEVLHNAGNGDLPMVSIITTVYDRVECLQDCIRSVKRQHFTNYEHIVVADCPPDEILKKMHETIQAEDNGKLKLVNLTQRYNNWGIKPASVGIGLGRGKYVCFLSDDNGYQPEHLGMLVTELENHPDLGFVYSSCHYDGRRILNSSVPAPACIDLGQPMFRRELFVRHFQNNLPFNLFAWDWHMIERFMKNGVRWKHINNPTFFFRLKKYPEVLDNLNREQEKITLINHNPSAAGDANSEKTDTLSKPNTHLIGKSSVEGGVVLPILFTLIHPSRGRAKKARETYNLWIEKMSKSNRIQYLLSLDESDPELNRYEQLFVGLTSMIISDTDCVVQATNEAAKQAKGDILIYLSDDFDCPDKWDSLLAEEINKRSLNPERDKFMLKVDDCLQHFSARLLTIPIMSKRLYDHLGYFWYPEYRSMFSDQDLFEVCKQLQALIFVPHLKFQHKHPSIGMAETDLIYRRSEENWTLGEEIYSARKCKNFNI